MVKLTSFAVSHYPDGHKHIKSDKDLHGDNILEASIKSFDDLFLIAQVKKIHPELTYLHINYMLASRCDRRFSPGEAVDIEIVANFINSLGFEFVHVLRPHSEQTIRSIVNSTPLDITDRLIRDLLQDEKIRLSDRETIFVIPDNGARNWVQRILIDSLYFNDFIECSKERDLTTGRINITMPHYNHYNDCRNFIIVDDLCDGGGTFVEIARQIKAQKANAKIFLVVTHAIFSKGFQPFEGLIDRIYCTDSFAEFSNPLVKQRKL